jgi:hypothetical protein
MLDIVLLCSPGVSARRGTYTLDAGRPERDNLT